MCIVFKWLNKKSIYSLKTWINYVNSFALSWVSKVTNRTSSFISVIANAGTESTTVPVIIKQFPDQVRIRLISQSINGISRVLQKIT